MATTKSTSKSEASKEMKDPKASKEQKSDAAKTMSSGAKKKSSK